MSQEKSSSSSSAPVPSKSNNGIINPSGWAMLGFGPVYLAVIPVASFLSREGGIVPRLVRSAVGLLVPGIKQDRIIPGIAAFYTFMTFAMTGAGSVAGQALGREKGLDNNHPRIHPPTLRGLPLRLYSAHYNLMEHFPSFALAAALTQTLAPGNVELTNLLGLHVLLKLGIYYPAYLANVGPVRSLSHILATGTLIGIGWKLAQGAI